MRVCCVTHRVLLAFLLALFISVSLLLERYMRCVRQRGTFSNNILISQTTQTNMLEFVADEFANSIVKYIF